jgi:putative membrane protein
MTKYILLTLTLILAAPICWAVEGPDAAFYKSAAEGGIAEVELGKLAQEKSSSQSVKDFGAMMVSDHSAANEKLNGIAAAKNMQLPLRPSIGQMATKAKLEVLSGATFDKSYIKGMVKDHQEDIKEFQKEAARGRDPEAKAFAKATLPTLRAHLKKIQAIAIQEGVKAD